MAYQFPKPTYKAPYTVEVCLEYYDYIDTVAKSPRKYATFDIVRAVVDNHLKKYHTGNGVNRVFCKVLDANGQYVPPSVWGKEK